MRVLIISDRTLSRQALTSAAEHIPGAIIVDAASQLNDIWSRDEQDAIDVVMADMEVFDNSRATITMFGALAPPGPGDNQDPFAYMMSCGFAQLAAEHGISPEAVEDRFWQNWQTIGSPDELSSRERVVFILLGMGLSNQRIARVLGVTDRTIKSHVGRILTKLNIESRLQAGIVAFAYAIHCWISSPNRAISPAVRGVHCGSQPAFHDDDLAPKAPLTRPHNGHSARPPGYRLKFVR